MTSDPQVSGEDVRADVPAETVWTVSQGMLTWRGGDAYSALWLADALSGEDEGRVSQEDAAALLGMVDDHAYHVATLGQLAEAVNRQQNRIHNIERSRARWRARAEAFEAALMKRADDSIAVEDSEGRDTNAERAQ